MKRNIFHSIKLICLDLWGFQIFIFLIVFFPFFLFSRQQNNRKIWNTCLNIHSIILKWENKKLTNIQFLRKIKLGKKYIMEMDFHACVRNCFLSSKFSSKNPKNIEKIDSSHEFSTRGSQEICFSDSLFYFSTVIRYFSCFPTWIDFVKR